jgi:hypothetical protein
MRGGAVDPHAVKVPVTASISIECLFWAESDGWTGACPELSISVRGGNFEESRKNMEAALGDYITRLLKDKKMAA